MTRDAGRRDPSTTSMKDLERQYRTVLPAKSYAVIRVNGKGFSESVCDGRHRAKNAYRAGRPDIAETHCIRLGTMPSPVTE